MFSYDDFLLLCMIMICYYLCFIHWIFFGCVHVYTSGTYDNFLDIYLAGNKPGIVLANYRVFFDSEDGIWTFL